MVQEQYATSGKPLLGVCNSNTIAKWSLWCGCRGNVLNILSHGDQGHEAMEIPQCLSVNLVSIKLTVRSWHSLRVLLLERGNSQDQNKAKSSWGFGTHFSYPLSERVWLKTSDILPVGKDVYFWLYTFLKSLSWDIYPFKNYHRPLKFLWLSYTKHSLWKIASFTRN